MRLTPRPRPAPPAPPGHADLHMRRNNIRPIYENRCDVTGTSSIFRDTVASSYVVNTRGRRPPEVACKSSVELYLGYSSSSPVRGTLGGIFPNTARRGADDLKSSKTEPAKDSSRDARGSLRLTPRAGPQRSGLRCS